MLIQQLEIHLVVVYIEVQLKVLRKIPGLKFNLIQRFMIINLNLITLPIIDLQQR